MSKTIHTVTLPDGTTAKRVSVNNEYPFVLVGQPSKEWDVARAGATQTDASNWEYYAECAKTTPGDTPPGRRFPVSPGERAHGKAIVAKHGSAEEYVAALVAERMAKIADDEAKGHYRRWDALAWSSRRDLAEKAMAKFSHRTKLRVLETVRVAT